MSDSFSSVCSILDMPDDILVEIFLYFDARERLELAHSCSRFSNLVFEHEELARDLDFSKNIPLTRATHIQQYFSNEITCQLMRKFNIGNNMTYFEQCWALSIPELIEARHMLNNSIGRAINLVDINFLCLRFEDIQQLGSYLEPLVHLKRLSFHWPQLFNSDDRYDENNEDNEDDEVDEDEEHALISNILQKPFSRLTYLFIEVEYATERRFCSALALCQELVELHVTSYNYSILDSMFYTQTRASNILAATKLSNLRILDLQTCKNITNDPLTLIMDPEEWTDLQVLIGLPSYSVYLVKNVEISEELRKTKFMNNIPEFLYGEPFVPIKCGSCLIPERLLREVIRITHQDVPEELCLNPNNSGQQMYLLNVNEAKRLLKDPGYQISFLNFVHQIEPDCDAHLVASAFPNLTQLVFEHIMTIKEEASSPKQKKYYQRRLRRKNSTDPEERDDPGNLDSSFKMLVENTPHVRDLTIDASTEREDRPWDMEALRLIPFWKKLKILRLIQIPLNDSKFLIDIGKGCPQLETITLCELTRFSEFYENRFTDDLTQMLSHCRNLKELSITEDELRELPKLFTTLSNNLKLRSVSIETVFYPKVHQHDHFALVSSIEQLLHRCTKLTNFAYINFHSAKEEMDELRLALERIKSELNRPDLQFQESFRF